LKEVFGVIKYQKLVKNRNYQGFLEFLEVCMNFQVFGLNFCKFSVFQNFEKVLGFLKIKNVRNFKEYQEILGISEF
jgi:hypothetical protein